MKRKIFSMLLLGVLMVTSASMFVSCKDYDDDINANKSSITALQEQVNTLKTALDKAQGDATAANAALETLKQTVNGNSDAVKTAAADAAAAMAKAQAVESALNDAKALMETVVNGKADQSDLDALATKVASIDTSLLTIEGKVTANEAAIGNIKTQISALEYLKQLYPAGSESITSVISRLDDAKDAIGNWTDEKTIAEKMNELSSEVSKLSEQVNVLTYLVNRKLTSIVLKPEFYYGGIEGIEVPALRNYAPWNIVDDTILGTIDEQWALETDDEKFCTIEQGGVAEYHINPTTAKLDGYKLDFYGNAAQVRSGAQFATPKTKTVTNEFLAENYKDGILSVPFDIDYEMIQDLDADQLPMIALQMSKASKDNAADSVVTSDYAMILNTNYKDLYIADNAHKDINHYEANYYSVPSYNGYHLWGNIEGQYVEKMVGTVDQKVATHKVEYNSSIDLTQFVEVHYTYSYKASDGTMVFDRDKVMSRSIMKALGLKFVYDYIDYTMGNFGTDETAHITLTNGKTGENGLATPNGINADGTRNSAAKNNRAAIGRLPIVRVSLVDAHNHTLKVAYIKLEITDAAAPAKEFGFNMNDIYADCEDVPMQLMWNDVEYTIYTGLDMSKAQFEANYGVVIGGNVYPQYNWNIGYLDQFYAVNQNKMDDSYVNVEDATPSTDYADFCKEKFGYFMFHGDADDPTTNVLSWTVTSDELKRLYYVKNGDNYIIDRNTGLNTVAIERYVKFQGYNNTGHNVSPVYVKFTIPVGKLHYAIGEPGAKIPAYWYGLNGYNEQANGMEVHINTVVPNTLGDDCAFTKDLRQFFQGDKIVFGFNENFVNFIAEDAYFTFTTPSIAKGNAAFNAEEDGTWKVKGVSGAEYTLKATPNAIVAIMDPDDTTDDKYVVKIAADGTTLNYQRNDVALDILNYKGRTGAGVDKQSLGSLETFTAYLEVNVEVCYKAFIKNQYVNARFLRPVNLAPTEGKTIQDAVDGGSKIDIMDLVTLHDWRWYDFAHKGADYDAIVDANGSYAEPHYINYYGVKLYANQAEAVTDLDKSEAERVVVADPSNLQKLSVVAPSVELSITNSNNGTVTADYNDSNYAGKLSGNDIVYKNNSGNVNNFHIYIPVYITYKWGAKWNKCQKVWGVITVKKTVGTEE